MKITYKDRKTKEIMTAYEYEQIPKFLESLKNDDGKIDFAWEIQTAAALFDCNIVLKSEARVCKYYRALNRYTESSGYLDIEFEILAYDEWNHFDKICCCLSDLWELTGGNHDEIRSRMYHVRFSRDKE